MNSKDNDGVGFTIGHTSRNGRTTSFLSTEYANNAGVAVNAGLFHQNQHGFLGATVSMPTGLTLDSLNLEQFSQLSGRTWALVKKKNIALGVSCQVEDGHPDTVEGVLCFSDRLHGSQSGYEPAAEFTLRAVQKLGGVPTFHATFYQRMVTRRRITAIEPRPFYQVKFITNYVDLGLDISLTQTGAAMSVGGAWQVGKNILVKGKFSDSSFSTMLAFKSWWNPNFTVAFTHTVPFTHGYQGRLGLAILIENWGRVGYGKVPDNYKRYVPLEMETVVENEKEE